jgi:hypothetical protein
VVNVYVDFSKSSLTYRDNTGNTARVSWYVGLDPTVGGIDDMRAVNVAVQTAMNACTNAKNVGVSGVFDVLPDPSLYGVAAQYNNVEDKARLQFNSNSRQRYTTLSIPAPLLSDFFSGGSGTGGDEETVNAADAHIIALVSALTTVIGGAAATVGPVNDTFHNLIVGKLIRRKARRKIGRWTKDPTGTIPA